MIHSATASDRLETSVKASVISLGMPMTGADLPTASSAVVSGGDIWQDKQAATAPVQTYSSCKVKLLGLG